MVPMIFWGRYLPVAKGLMGKERGIIGYGLVISGWWGLFTMKRNCIGFLYALI